MRPLHDFEQRRDVVELWGVQSHCQGRRESTVTATSGGQNSAARSVVPVSSASQPPQWPSGVERVLLLVSHRGWTFSFVHGDQYHHRPITQWEFPILVSPCFLQKKSLGKKMTIKAIQEFYECYQCDSVLEGKSQSPRSCQRGDMSEEQS